MLINYLPDPINDLTQFAFLTAWRKSEITSLRWEFVDRSTREIRIPTSKNLKGRVIPLSGTLGELIEKRRTARAYRKNGIPAVSHYVFHRDGRRMGSFYKTWKTACRKAGLSGVIFHDLRRSGIRSLVRSGVSETVARSISGHQTRSVFDRYDIVDTRDQEEAFRKVEEYLRSQPSEPSVAPIGPTNPHTSRTKKPSEDLRALGTH